MQYEEYKYNMTITIIHLSLHPVQIALSSQHFPYLPPIAFCNPPLLQLIYLRLDGPSRQIVQISIFLIFLILIPISFFKIIVYCVFFFINYSCFLVIFRVYRVVYFQCYYSSSLEHKWYCFFFLFFFFDSCFK
jgi:hypothetical protein